MKPGDGVKLSEGYLDAWKGDDLLREALRALRGVVQKVYRAGVVEVIWGRGTERSEMAADLELVE